MNNDNKNDKSDGHLSSTSAKGVAKVSDAPRPAEPPGAVSVGAKFAATLDDQIALKQAQQVEILQSATRSSDTSTSTTISASTLPGGSAYLSPSSQQALSAYMAAKKGEARSGPRATEPGVVVESSFPSSSSGLDAPVAPSVTSVRLSETALSSRVEAENDAAKVFTSDRPPAMGATQVRNINNMSPSLQGRWLDTFEEDVLGKAGLVIGPDSCVEETGGSVDLQQSEHDDDLDFGMLAGQSLVVARPVDEAEQVEAAQDLNLPSAVEYDPDSKPVAARRRFRFCIGFGIMATLIIGIGIVVGVVVSGSSDTPIQAPPTLAPTTYRDTLGIREMIQSVVRAELLADVTSPYSRALEWLMYDDPLELTPSNRTLYQRYFAAYLYLATSSEKPWSSCAPPVLNESSSCTYNEFYYRLGVSRYYYLDASFPSSRWMSGEHECWWAGITCDDQDQIRSINLRGLNMTGTFPEGIQFLPFLQSFVVFWGQLHGSIPPEIASMKSLEMVGLRNNDLSGQIPTAIWSMPSLRMIDFGSNRLTGTFPTEMMQVTDLKWSVLHNNLFKSSSVPTEVGLLRSLSYMYWDSTQLGGTVPTEIGNCQRLIYLGLSENGLTGTIPTELGRIKSNLVTIDVNTNSLKGTLPIEVFSLPVLEHIYVQSNRLTGRLSADVGQLTRLIELYVQHNHFTGPIPSQLGSDQLASLTEVFLNDNDFTGTMPASVCARRGTVFAELAADCLPDPKVGEVECPASCCTLCCGANQADSCRV